jgi:hypothetical protein
MPPMPINLRGAHVCWRPAQRLRSWRPTSRADRQGLLGEPKLRHAAVRMAVAGAVLLAGGCASDTRSTQQQIRGDANNDPSATDLVRLSGVVRNRGVVQEEPQAEPQTNFWLEDVRGIPGLRGGVIVTGPGYMFCSEGERLVVEGHFMPPSRLINTPILDGARILKCGR